MRSTWCLLSSVVLAACSGKGNEGGGGGASPSKLAVLDMGITRTHACAVRASDGSVWCWGANAWGELGDGTTTPRSAPTRVAGIEGAVQVEVRERTGCARLGTGAVWCWGQRRPDPAAKVGDPLGAIPDAWKTAAPTETPFLADATELSLAANAVCALRKDGGVRCYDFFNKPVEVEALRGSTAIATSLHHVAGARGTTLTGVDLGKPELPTTPFSFESGGAVESIDRLAGGNAICALAHQRGSSVLFCAGDTNSPSDRRLRNLSVLSFEPRALALTGGVGTLVGADGRLATFRTSGTADDVTVRDSGSSKDHAAVWGGGRYTCVARKAGSLECQGTLEAPGVSPAATIVIPSA